MNKKGNLTEFFPKNFCKQMERSLLTNNLKQSKINFQSLIKRKNSSIHIILISQNLILLSIFVILGLYFYLLIFNIRNQTSNIWEDGIFAEILYVYVQNCPTIPIIVRDVMIVCFLLYKFVNIFLELSKILSCDENKVYNRCQRL